MGKAFTEAEKADVKEAIIKSAYEAFESKPFKDVKIEAIAKAAGIGKGTLYLFFSSKEQMFAEVMMRFEERLQSRIRKELESALSPKDKLIEALTIGLLETDDNEIYKALMDADLMGRIVGTLTETQLEKMADLDLSFIDSIIGLTPIKVSRELAVDLLRSVFYLRLYESQLLSPKEAFYKAYLQAIVHQIL